MTPSIRVDKEVYEYLKERAEPFVDSPNSVLRRILGLAPTATGDEEKVGTTPPEEERIERKARARKARRRRGKGTRHPSPRTRAAAGTVLGLEAYTLPLLQALAESGGRAAAREAIDSVGKRLNGQLTQQDLETISSGEVRWRNRVQFARLRLIEEGLIARNSPRGVWELTEQGRTRAMQSP